MTTNTTIVFTPTRSIITPAPPPGAAPFEEYIIEVTLKSFDMAPEEGSKTSKSLDGTIIGTNYYETYTYSCTIIVDINDNDAATTEELKMFFSSTLSAEELLITNLDTGDVMNCQRVGSYSPTRESAGDVNIFGWQFTVRETTS